MVKSAIWLEDKAREAERTLGERIPRALIDVLQHVLISHHGKAEFGCAKLPATPEALFISMIDDMDAKMQLVLQACRSENNAGGEGNWTEYVKAMSGRLYRPDVAPADAPEGEAVDAPAAEPAAAPTLKLAITNPLFESIPVKKK